MEQRLTQLEEEAEGLAQRPDLFNHELIYRLRHDDPQTAIHRTQAATRPFLPLYSDASTSPSVPSTSGIVTGFQIQEGHGTVVARTTIEAGLQRVASTGEVPPDLRDLLSVSHSSIQSWIYDTDLNLATHSTRILLPFRCHFHFYIFIPRFLYHVRLPPSHPESPHPALLNAIFLAACNIGGDSMSAYEPLFLARIRPCLEQSLFMNDRLVHFMWASVILACYYTRVGRVVEAHHALSGAVRFAESAGCHSESVESQSTLIPPPTDDIEKLERANLWCALTLCEASISIVAGLPPSAPVDVSRGYS